MKKLLFFLICILPLTTLIGCVPGEARIKCWAFCDKTEINVTYYSDPAGAMLYSGGRYMGVTPLTLTYPVTPGFRQGQCQGTDQVLVRRGRFNAATSRQLLSIQFIVGVV